MPSKIFQNGISSYIEMVNHKKSFEELLSCKEPGRYALKVNLKYSSIMPHAFWCAISRCYWPLCFVDLHKDIIYELEERRSSNGSDEHDE